ncbi:MAG TPA: DUF983 domain-containing protein [Gemmatimonadales bacterium]|nr:DUF983 domain-containing protein [Gemmatimonadales bacterium]
MWRRTGRLRAILRQRCPVCFQGRMFSGPFTMRDRCPVCGHQFEREQGFFQGAMYVSYTLGIFVFAFLVGICWLLLARRVGPVRTVLVAALLYFPLVPALFRYSRAIWAHVNIGTLGSEGDVNHGFTGSDP